MRIGVLCKEKETPRRGFEVAKTAQFGAVEIYKASVFDFGGKRRFAREVKKCVRTLLRLGVTVCAAEEELARISTGKMNFVCSGERMLRMRAGDAAESFAECEGISADILICGGGFTEAVEAAKQILASRRNVYVVNHAFDDIAEEVYCETGVSICRCGQGRYLEINLGGEGHFLEFEEKNVDFSDISVSIPEIFSSKIPVNLIPQLAETLEISGFLRKNEIKVGYFPK